MVLCVCVFQMDRTVEAEATNQQVITGRHHDFFLPLFAHTNMNHHRHYCVDANLKHTRVPSPSQCVNIAKASKLSSFGDTAPSHPSARSFASFTTLVPVGILPSGIHRSIH